MNRLEATVSGEFATTRSRLEEALSEQGFGVRWTGDATEIRILDPERAFTLASDEARSELEGLAIDVRSRLVAALQSATS